MATEDPSLARRVAERHRKGFVAGDKVIRPEVVSVFVVKVAAPSASPDELTLGHRLVGHHLAEDQALRGDVRRDHVDEVARVAGGWPRPGVTSLKTRPVAAGKTAEHVVAAHRDPHRVEPDDRAGDVEAVGELVLAGEERDADAVVVLVLRSKFVGVRPNPMIC